MLAFTVFSALERPVLLSRVVSAAGGNGMAWRRLLLVPLLVVLVPAGAGHAVFRLPMLCCHRLRAVRWLPLAGLCYYSVAVAALVVVLGWKWGAVLLATAVIAGDWLLPNPIMFVLMPAWRRAALRVIEYVEQRGGPRPMYWRVQPAGFDRGRPVVAVGVGGGYGFFAEPVARLLLAVGPGGAVEELDREWRFLAAMGRALERAEPLSWLTDLRKNEDSGSG